MNCRGGKLLAIILAAALLVLMAGTARAAEFSARIVSKSGGQESYGKIFVKGQKIRRESGGPEAIIIVTLVDRKLARIIRPNAKIYLEMPLTEDMIKELRLAGKDRSQMKLLGTETVQGYQTDKYETLYKTDHGEVAQFIWIAPKLEMPIKIVFPDGSFSLEYRDIKEERVDDALFDPPPGYQKIGSGPQNK